MKLGRRPKSAVDRIVVIGVAIAGLFAADRLVAMAMGYAVSGSDAVLARLYTGRLNADGIVVGNSRAAKSFDVAAMSRRTGQDWINLGVNGMRPELTHAMLRDYQDRCGLPSTLVLEVSYLKSRWSDSAGAEFLLWARYGANMESVLRHRLPTASRAADWFHLRRFGSQQYFRTLANRHGGDQNTAARRRINDQTLAGIERLPIERFEIHRQIVGDLKSILDDWESRGTTIRLVLAPYLPTFLTKIDNLQSWLEDVSVLLDRPIVDDSDAVIEPIHYADQVHLNRDGQAIFTDLYLGQISSSAESRHNRSGVRHLGVEVQR